MDQFTKIFSKSAGDVRSMANTMISNGNNFCCVVLDVGVKNTIINEDGEKEDITVYPTQECAINNIKTMLTKELAFKQLPQKALEEMAKKGLSPKKQPIEILLFIIVPCDVSVVVAVNNINNMIDMSDFCNHIDGESGDDNMVVKYTDSSLKESDNINRNIFNYLKQVGIYNDTTDEDMIFDF